MDDGYEPTTPMESDNEQGPGEPEPTDDVPISGSGAPHTTDEVRPKSASMPQPAPPGLLGQAADQAPLPQEVPVPTTPMSLEPEPLEEPGVPASITQSEFPVPPQQQQFFKPNKPETFAEQRARVARQETLLFKPPEGYAPVRNEPARATPYSERPLAEDEKVDFVLDVDFLSKTSLPPGWTFEDGFLQLGEVQDEWRLRGNHLIRYHYLARNKEFKPTADNCPIPLEYLSNQRYTKLTCGKLVRDKWTRTQLCRQLTGHYWTGYTSFKIQTCWRKAAKNKFNDQTFGAESIYLQEDKSHAPLSERYMSLADRLAFTEAKQKNLHLSSRMMFGLLTARRTSSLAEYFEPSSS